MRPGTGFAYQPIDTGDGAILMKDSHSGASERTCFDTRGKVFNMLVAFVLVANVVFLCLEADLDLLGEDDQHWGGLERDMGLLGINHAQQAGVEAEIQDGLKADQKVKATVKSALQQDVKSILHENVNIHGELESGSYSSVEFFFIAFYFIEICFRLCDLGCGAYCRDPWFYVDVTVVLAGVTDLTLPIIMPKSTDRTLEEILRLVRVLRILRLFRVVPALRAVGRAFLNAIYTVLWILALIAIINLVCAVFLTTFVGQRAHLWEDHAVEVHLWFGSLLRSMMTLSMFMTPSSLDHIIQVLVIVVPRLVVMSVIFAYIFMCGFTMLGLIAGMINTTFVSSQLEDERLGSQHEQEKRVVFASAFADILATCDQSRNGSLCREEFSAALESHPAVFQQLQMLGIDTSIDGLLHVFDRLSQDPSFDGAIKVGHLVEATSHLGAKANAAGVFELKYHLLGMRHDTGKQVSDLARTLGTKQEMTSAAIEARFAEVQDVVARVQRELSSACQATTAVSQKVESLERLEERERCRQNDILSATNSKLDAVFSQLNSTLFTLNSRVAAQSGMVEKIENLAAQVTSQAAVKDKIHELTTQLAAAQATMHEKVNVVIDQFTQNGSCDRLERLWPLYEAKMKKGGKESASTAAINAFKHKFEALVSGVSTMIPECSLAPMAPLPDFETLSITEKPELLQKTVVLKLNSGVGTLDRAISSMSVTGQHTCLDLIAKQVEWMKIEHKQPNLQFMLMNSSSTSEDTKALLSKYPILGTSSDLEFVQNKAPKIHSTDMSPADWPANRDHEWCPSGHGDLFSSLMGSGTFDKLLEKGMKYMFVSNSDNLGASVDLKLLTHFADSGAPFMMEVAARTNADKKRGHLATVKKTGDMTLREAAQCSKEDESAFQDTSKYGYFSTNNLWIDLEKLKALLDKHDGTLPLPVMVSEKTVDPHDKNSAKVIHLETPTGAAICCFEGAITVLTSRSRFLPVETCDDLFALRSDAYVATPDFQLELAPERNGVPPVVKLDDRYKLVDAMDSLIPNGVPSLKECNSLRIEGPMDFAVGVVIKGDVTIKSTQKRTVPQGTYKDQVITL